MRVILFYNVVYVYVCKIRGDKFGSCWWFFPWLGQSNSVAWHPRCICNCPNESTGPLFQFWSIQRLILSFTVSASIWGTVVNRHKAFFVNRLALCYDSWTSRQLYDVLLFQSADRSWILIGCMDQDGRGRNNSKISGSQQDYLVRKSGSPQIYVVVIWLRFKQNNMTNTKFEIYSQIFWLLLSSSLVVRPNFW